MIKSAIHNKDYSVVKTSRAGQLALFYYSICCRHVSYALGYITVAKIHKKNFWVQNEFQILLQIPTVWNSELDVH